MNLTGNRIDLAHEADFAIGPLSVRPSTREVERDGRREIVEPRVMQVLVALHRAGGAVVSKDDLTESCWEGRVVGEDAINRVISRLRKLADGPGKGAFVVETITRVGYRLRRSGDDGRTGAHAHQLMPNRRRLLAVAGLGALGVASLGGWWLVADSGSETEEFDDLLRRGRQAYLYGTPEQVSLGISLLQQATRVAPENPEAWGLLAEAYGGQAQQSAQADYERLIAKSESAANRALELDPDNADALVTRALGRREAGDRVTRDAALNKLVGRFPDNPTANRAYAFLLAQAGRTAAALMHLSKAIDLEPSAPGDAYALSGLYWALGRLDEADLAMENAFAKWPRHYGVWFSRYKHLAYTRRFEQARAQLADEGGRPIGIPQSNFDLCAQELTAFESREAEDIAKAERVHRAAAATGVGFAQNAISFAAETGNADMLFELADAMYFDRDGKMSQRRFSAEQGLFNPARRRPTYYLFTPPFEPYLRDPRFRTLLEGVGLVDYWRRTKSAPDNGVWP